MSETSVFEGYPEVSFIDNATLQGTLEKCLAWYKERHREVTGEEIRLEDADPMKLLLDTMAYMHFQRLMYLDQLGKMNLLKYSHGAFLDNLGANVSQPPRDLGKRAYVKMQVILSKEQKNDYIIPAGTLFASEDNTFFESGEDLILPAGCLSGEVLCTCTEPGEDGNGYEVGEIQSLVTALPYVQDVMNTTVSTGGEEEESDESYAESVFLAASQPNTTGNDDGYKYVIRQVSSQIGDIMIDNPTPLQVDISFLLKDGTLPSDELIYAVETAVKNSFKRSLNDYITVKIPETAGYEIDVKYWINESDRAKSLEIQKEVKSAIDRYKLWQAGKLGRDINPGMLQHYMMGAGIKRMVVNAPKDTVVEKGTVPLCSSVNVVYGGIEDD